MSRLEMLIRDFEEDPKDPFNIYALAIEYLKTDREKSRSLFEILMDQHPDYVPTYYHAAKLYQDLNARDRAISTYEKGMLVATNQGEQKAYRELRAAYDELMFD
jgi:Tfp pilus assembly protein PilF